jgi:hypothetical protein
MLMDDEEAHPTKRRPCDEVSPFPFLQPITIGSSILYSVPTTYIVRLELNFHSHKLHARSYRQPKPFQTYTSLHQRQDNDAADNDVQEPRFQSRPSFDDVRPCLVDGAIGWSDGKSAMHRAGRAIRSPQLPSLACRPQGRQGHQAL